MKINLKKLLKSLSQNQLILNMGTVLIITYAIKLLGFFKESLIASQFGLSELIDTYLLAMILPALIQSVFLSSFSNVFVPNYVKALKQKEDIPSFQTSCVILTVSIGLVLLVVSFFSFQPFLETIFPGHEQNYYELITKQFYFLIACIPFWAVSSLLTGMLNIENEFRFSTLSSIFIPLITIVNIYFFIDFFGETVLAVSTLLGTVFSFVYLIIVNFYKKLLHLGKPDFKNSNFTLMLRQVPYKMSSSLFTSLIPTVDNYFAAKLIVGSIAAISFGQKIPAFVLGFSMVGLGTVLLPHFSKLVDTDIKRAYLELFKILKYLLIGSLVIVGILIIFSPEIVQLLFERNEFDSEDTMVVARIQQILLAYVPFYLCGNVLVKFLTSINKNKFMAQMSTINFIANGFLDYFLFQEFGVNGIVMSTAIIYSINPFIYYIYTRKQFNLLKSSQ